MVGEGAWSVKGGGQGPGGGGGEQAAALVTLWGESWVWAWVCTYRTVSNQGALWGGVGVPRRLRPGQGRAGHPRCWRSCGMEGPGWEVVGEGGQGALTACWDVGVVRRAIHWGDA